MTKKFSMPAAFLTASATISEKQTKLEAKTKAIARIDMSAEVAGAGLCPECGRPMEHSNANGIPVLICEEHRIALPAPDQMDNKIPI